MFNLQSRPAETIGQPEVRTVTWRIGGRLFWLVLVSEAVLLLAVLAWVLSAAPRATAPTATGDVALVRQAIWARLQGQVDDPLLEVQPGVSVRASNLRGFALNDRIYYYYLPGRTNFDPLSRGSVQSAQVEILLREDDGPFPLVVYTVRN